MKNMVEQETVWMSKDVSRALTEEIEAAGLTGKTTRAEFLGALLSDAILSIRAAREAAVAMAKSPLMEPYTPERAAEIVGGQG